MTLSDLTSDRDVRQVSLGSLINKLTIRTLGVRIDRRINLTDIELEMLEGILGRIQ